VGRIDREAVVSPAEVRHMFESASVHPAIAVTDLERAKAFYGGTLGLKTKDERADGVTYESGGTWLLVYPSQFAGTNQATYMTFEVSDVEAAIDELVGKGVTFEQYDFPGLKTDARGIAAIDGTKGAWFKDPDGNILAVGQTG
jgi:catechol 2,3-dioxygenase-like lactoylglutathione lyase family enzyme